MVSKRFDHFLADAHLASVLEDQKRDLVIKNKFRETENVSTKMNFLRVGFVVATGEIYFIYTTNKKRPAVAHSITM